MEESKADISFEGSDTFVSEIESPGLHISSSKLLQQDDDILKRVKSHPLQKGYRSPLLESISTTSGTNTSFTSSPIDTISLIQAAARSILDDSPGSSNNISDDESSVNRSTNEYKSCNLEKYACSSPALKSLRKQILPALPDEQDRKRFVGCLAAVLASCYSYDVIAPSIEKNEASDRTYKLDMDGQDKGGCSDEMEESNHALHLSSVSGSFDYPEIRNESSYLSCGPDFILENMHNQRMRTFGTRNSTNTAYTRHRKRRYEVLSKLLIQSAELLRLDRSQGKCFLPMLTKLLSPSTKPVLKKESLRDHKPPLISRGSQRRRSKSDRHKQTSRIEESSSFREQSLNCFLERQMDEIENLRPFLESMPPGAGLRCLAMFLTQHLLHSEVGYDSRIRHAVKTLGVLLVMHDMLHEPENYTYGDDIPEGRPSSKNGMLMTFSAVDFRTKAIRIFESLESSIASKLINLSRDQAEAQQRYGKNKSGNNERNGSSKNILTRQPRSLASENLLRGLKIGGTAVAAGALFAVTGGLAAPGIAAGVAAIAGGTALTATAASLLTSTVAVTAIFGVGGGGLAAYKMQRRTIGLTEFEFVKECNKDLPSNQHQNDTNHDAPEAELFSTICLSGWLRDNCDFQRPWGITPTRPRIRDRLELLERFYAIYSPDHIPKCSKILSSWRGEEKKLWNVLRLKYGRDPSCLFPLENGQRSKNSLSLEQCETVDHLFKELGYIVPKHQLLCQTTPLQRMLHGKVNYHLPAVNPSSLSFNQTTVVENRYSLNDSLHGPTYDELSNTGSVTDDNIMITSSSEDDSERDTPAKVSKHIATVWDYQTTYGGELYTVRWETGLLTELCDSVADLAFDVVSGGTAHLLQYTALSTLMSAIAWPYALIHAANMIDSTWTLGVERADAAGKELARSLLFSTAGNRPVTLVGFSFGARAIYSCLKELARYQQKWEDFQERKDRFGFRTMHQKEEDSDLSFSKMREPASIVEDVVLMGLPNHLSLTSWKACRQIVAGRLVHCFSQKDLILSLMFQIKKFGLKPVCGTCPVDVPGVENVDVTDIITGHQDYCLYIGTILKRIRHCEPFQSNAPSYLDSDFKADDVVREVAKLGIK